MLGFRYKYGDRPLEGYTIQRAAGRGGFGEVYYAVSDSGREVALKVVSGYEQIELRGVGQCMNLKSPHLVTIFDVKHNDEGVPFVIMEFVSGPSLRQLLDESPSGLGMQKTAFFLREIGKGLAFLHECGIVHRDLKPGNIFYENGYVKIGDYGLSKAMAASQHSGQTITVGTVHYMAPEISMGKYDRSIDIYALGAMLYEMLTGQTPYLGASPGEILMKHMTAEPDVSGIEEPFATVIRKAMHRDPAQRYASVQEVVEAVFGAEHVQQSVSCFSPDSLSMVAQRVAERVAVGGGSATPPPLPRRGTGGLEHVGGRLEAIADRVGERMSRFGDRMGELGNRLGDRMGRLGDRLTGAPRGESAEADGNRDPLSRTQRRVLGLCVIVVISAVLGFLGPRQLGNDAVEGAFLAFLAILGATLGMRLAARRLLPQLAAESLGIQRLALGGIGALLMMAVSFPMVASTLQLQRAMGGTIGAVLLPLVLMDWVAVLKPGRAERVGFGHAIGAGLLAFVVALVMRGCPELAVAVMAGTSLAVQVISPWDPEGHRRLKEHRVAHRSPATVGAAMSPEPLNDVGVAAAAPGGLSSASPSRAMVPPPLPPRLVSGERVVRPGWRYFWLACIPLFLASGIMTLVFAGTERMSADEFSITVGAGIGLIVLSFLSLLKMLQRTFVGWWSYLFKPLALLACVETILVASLMLGNCNLSGDETMIAVFFIVFGAVAIPILVFVRFGREPILAGATPEPLWAPPAALSETPTDVISAPRAGLPPPRAWPEPSVTIPPPVMPTPMSLEAGLIPIRSGLLGLAGAVALLASMAVGLAMAFDLPGMIAAGVPDARMATDIERDAREAGIDNWPRLASRVLAGISGIGMVVAAVLLLAARRWAGPAHMFRSLLGVGGYAIVITALALGAHVQWALAGANATPARVIRTLSEMNGAVVLTAAVIFVVSNVVLFWPSRRQGPARTGG